MYIYHLGSQNIDSRGVKSIIWDCI